MSKEFKGIGLKAKTLLGLSALLIIVVSSNLYFTNSLILRDKKAYIYENILLNAESIKKIFEDTIQHSLFQAEAVIMTSQSGGNWKQLFNKQDLVQGMRYHFAGSSKNEIILKDSFSQKSEAYQEFVKEWSEAKINDEAGLSILRPEKQNALEINLADDQRSINILVDMDSLWTRISNDLVFNYQIISKDGKILWKTGEDISPSNFTKQISSKSVSLVKEMSIDGTSYMVSMLTVPEAGIHVVSFIKSSKAFAVVGELSVKTISFGLLLLGFSLIIGLIFSSKLINPIKSLVEGAIHVADGNFLHQVVVNTKDELAILGERFNFMSGKVNNLLNEKEEIIGELREAKERIEDYSKNLEVKVQERTWELKSANDFIQAMINSLDQGLFVVDKEMKCSSIYTKACEEMFQKSPAGLKFEEVLDLSMEQRELTDKWSEIIFTDMIPFESAAELGIQQKIYGQSIADRDYKHLKLSYHPMRNEDETINNIVVVSTDKTSEVRAKEETKKKERYVEMIFKILGAKRQFIDFTKEMDDYLKNLDLAIEANPPALDESMLIYHTLNGGLAMYAVDSLVDEVRKCEQAIVEMRKTKSIDHELLLQQKYSLKQNYTKFRTDIFRTLGFQSNMYEVDQSVILYLNDLVNSTDNRELKFIFAERIMKVPVEDFFLPYKELLVMLSQKLGKEIAPLKITNGDVRVDPDMFRELFSSLVHLFRNCADHGIEIPDTRLSRGKDRVGQISVDVKLLEDGQKLKLVIEDDGGGINPERVRKKLLEKDPDNQKIMDESDEEVVFHIFDQDFSTAEQVTSISGRGVGMSAIKDIVDRMQGRISIESRVEKGTKFIFDLPLS